MKTLTMLMMVLAPAAMAADTTVFEQVDVVRVGSGEVLEDLFVVVEDDRVRVVATEDPQIENAHRIDGRGLYLAPGLAEMHAHIPPSSDAQKLADVLFLYLSQGITTARGMLGEPGHLRVREQAETGEIDSPRIVTSGPSLNGNSVSSPSLAEQMVREQHAAGYDHIKIHPGLTPDEFDALARTARELGIKFVGHVDDSYGARHAIEAGMTGIDHMDGFLAALVPADSAAADKPQGFFGLAVAEEVDPDQIERFARYVAQHGTWVAPTETLMVSLAGTASADALLGREEMQYIDAATREQWRQAKGRFEDTPGEQRARFLRLRADLISALQKAGANLLLASDAPQVFNVPGFSVHRELALYVDAGLTPQQALATGTVNVARYLDETQRGEIKDGYAADLVLLGGNPLEDIANAADVRGVMVAGRWYDAQTIAQRLEEIAARRR